MLLLRKIWYGFEVLGASIQNPRYATRRGYLHRKSVSFFIDEGNTDEYQKEVYTFARNFIVIKDWKVFLIWAMARLLSCWQILRMYPKQEWS